MLCSRFVSGMELVHSTAFPSPTRSAGSHGGTRSVSSDRFIPSGETWDFRQPVTVRTGPGRLGDCGLVPRLAPLPATPQPGEIWPWSFPGIPAGELERCIREAGGGLRSRSPVRPLRRQ